MGALGLGPGAGNPITNTQIDERARDAVGSALTAGLGITVTPNDGANTVTVARTSDTSFPGSPASGALFWHSDRKLEYVYDGTRWLSTQVFERTWHMSTGLSATATHFAYALPYNGTYGIWLERFEASVRRDAAGEWDVVLSWLSETNVATTLATIDGAGTTDGNWITAGGADLNSVLDANAKTLRVAWSEISGAAGFYGSAQLRCRLIG